MLFPLQFVFYQKITDLREKCQSIKLCSKLSKTETETCKILMLAFGRRNVEQNTRVVANASNSVITASLKVLLQEVSTEQTVIAVIRTKNTIWKLFYHTM